MSAELGYTPVNLPSRGVLYEGQIPDGVVQVRKLKTGEEAILLKQGGSPLDRMNVIIEQCVKLPNGFEHQNLLIVDRMALLLSLRLVTFGARYDVSYKCPSCNNLAKVEMDLMEDLDENAADDSLSEPQHVKLPDSGNMVGLRFLRGVDEDRITKRAKRTMMKSNDPGDPSYQHRLALQIVSIDEKEGMTLPEREAFVRGITAKDALAIRTKIDDSEPGIDLQVVLECNHCGTPTEMTLPFTGEFFRPSRIDA